MTHKAPRGLLNFRIGDAGKAWLVDINLKTGASLSEVIRASLVVARKHEPEVLERLAEDDR